MERRERWAERRYYDSREPRGTRDRTDWDDVARNIREDSDARDFCRPVARGGLRSAVRGPTTTSAQPRIAAAAHSAIRIVGVWMLPEIMIGITEASATCRPSMPRTCNRCGSTTARSSVPIRQVEAA